LLTLEQVREVLGDILADEGKFAMVNCRLILRTGVNLRAISASQSTNPEAIEKVLSTLKEMGYELDRFGGSRRKP
jgi:hypothetical protein